MGMYDSLEFAKQEVAKCMKCGNCQEVCPIYLEQRIEGAVARGKIKLVDAILNGKLDFTDGLEEKIGNCLTCQACNAKCPCGVKVDKIILAARAEIVRRNGLHPLKKVIFNTVEKPKLFNLGLKTGGIFQGVVFKKHKEIHGYAPRFPFGLDMRRIVPELATKPFRERVPEVIKVDKPVKRVALFTGCSGNFMYPEIPEAVVKVLKANKVEIIVPKEQHCCGLPLFTHGDVKTAKKMAKSHIDIFSKLDVDAIITMCGSCGSSFNHHYVDFLADDPIYAENAKQVAAKVYDWSDFLVKVIGLDEKKLGEVKMKVTYHDPCHLNRGMGVNASPRAIINAIPGVEFTEMKNSDRCCGSAGSFSITHYDLSMDIHKKKWENVKATGAEAIVTGCGSCIMQLHDGLNRFGMNLPIMHTAQLLAKSYENKGIM